MLQLTLTCEAKVPGRGRCRHTGRRALFWPPFHFLLKIISFSFHLHLYASKMAESRLLLFCLLSHLASALVSHRGHQQHLRSTTTTSQAEYEVVETYHKCSDQATKTKVSSQADCEKLAKDHGPLLYFSYASSNSKCIYTDSCGPNERSSTSDNNWAIFASTAYTQEGCEALGRTWHTGECISSTTTTTTTPEYAQTTTAEVGTRLRGR